jgi:hypothetical protein
MMKPVKRYLSLLVLLLPAVFLNSCEEETIWPLHTEEGDLLVVQGMLTNELKSHAVILSRACDTSSGTPQPVSGAAVTLTDGSHVWTLQEQDTLAGTYLTPPMQGVLGRTYTLRISSGGRDYSATASLVPVTPLEPLRYHAVVNDGDTLYVLDYTESNIPAMTEVWADWSRVPGYDTLPATQTHAVMYCYTLNNVDPNALFPPAQEEVALPAGTLLVRRKYSLAPAYREYLRTLLSETAWRGSIFDVQPGNVNSNLTEDATGFFAACTVTEERTVFLP